MAKMPDPDLGRVTEVLGPQGSGRAKSGSAASVGGSGNHGGQQFGDVGRGLAGRHTDPSFSPEREEGATEDSEQGRPWPDRSSGGQGRGGPAKLLPGLGQQWASGSSPNAQTHVHWVSDPTTTQPPHPLSPLLLLPSVFPSIRVFPVSQFFASGGQSIGASASAQLPQPSSNAQQPRVVRGCCVKHHIFETFPSSQEVLGARPGAG